MMKVAEPMTLEEQFAATLLHDLREDLRRRLTEGTVLRHSGMSIPRIVDRRLGAGGIRGRLRLGNDELRFGVLRNRDRRRQRGVFVGRPNGGRLRCACLAGVRYESTRVWCAGRRVIDSQVSK